MKAYLAIPYTGMEDDSYRISMSATAHFVLKGDVIFSPIVYCHEMAKKAGFPGDFDFWEHFDRECIRACDELWVLKVDGWLTSKGVQAEIKIAEEMGKPIVYWDVEIRELNPMECSYFTISQNDGVIIEYVDWVHIEKFDIPDDLLDDALNCTHKYFRKLIGTADEMSPHREYVAETAQRLDSVLQMRTGKHGSVWDGADDTNIHA